VLWKEDERRIGSAYIADTQVDIASEWIIRGGRRLLRELLLNFMLTPSEEVLYIPGQEGSILSDWAFRAAN
jgi:hypothetical protein